VLALLALRVTYGAGAYRFSTAPGPSHPKIYIPDLRDIPAIPAIPAKSAPFVSISEGTMTDSIGRLQSRGFDVASNTKT
jgi:hypothetical protein